jgi:hypothetical protein
MKKTYVKLFLAYGLSFGILMSLWDYINDGGIEYVKIAFMILFFGGIMTWTSVRSMKRFKRKYVGEALTSNDFKAKQCKIIPSDRSIQSIYDQLKTNETTGKWKIKLENSAIAGRTRVSTRSWGERIRISKIDDKVKIESKPIIFTTLFDHGRNRENIFRMKQLIETNIDKT